MRVPIFWRITSGYAIILILFVGASSYSVIQLGQLSSTARTALETDNRMIGYQEKLTDVFLSEVRYAGRFIITHTNSLHEQFQQFKSDFSRYLGEIQSLAAGPDVKARLARVEELHLRYQLLFDQEVRYVKAGQPYAESRYQQEKEKLLESTLAELERLKRQLQKNLHHKLETMESAGRAARTIAGTTTLILLVLSISLSFVISKSITTPLSKLRRFTMEEREENLNCASDFARIPEIQELSDALHDTKRTLQRAAEINAHFADTITEQLTIPLISLKKRLSYLNEELAERATADQKIILEVLAAEIERLIQRCAELHAAPAAPGEVRDINPQGARRYVGNPVPSENPFPTIARSIDSSLMARTKGMMTRGSNLFALPWNAISHAIKLFASGRARKQ
jgi:CHASE3 domain sensor protein